MPTSPDDFPPTPAPGYSSHARDRGMRRSRRTTLWIAVTAATGAAALGGVYTHLLPGGSAAPAPAPAKVPVYQPAASNAAPAGKNDDGREEPNDHEEEDDDEGAAPVTRPAPQPPAQPPAPTRQQPQTTTGAS
jgi:hypothetical protein